MGRPFEALPLILIRACPRNSVRPSPWARKTLSTWYWFIHGADTPWLDSCDKHSNEGGVGVLPQSCGMQTRSSARRSQNDQESQCLFNPRALTLPDWPRRLLPEHRQSGAAGRG
ncbi:hypothetical protein GFM13_10310 [Rhizobium leguminosarum bv. viciae]|nr:hypothetical protein [Rhizobium leguminosarum bv. viciae]